MVEKIKTFFKEAQREWRHVNWPTRKEAIYLTSVVVGLSVALAVLLGAFDAMFIAILKTLILRV